MSDYIGGTRKPFSGLSALLYIDAKLVIPIIIITILGLVTIFSSSSGDLNLVIKQLTRVVKETAGLIKLNFLHTSLTRLVFPAPDGALIINILLIC